MIQSYLDSLEESTKKGEEEKHGDAGQSPTRSQWGRGGWECLHCVVPSAPLPAGDLSPERAIPQPPWITFNTMRKMDRWFSRLTLKMVIEIPA